MSALQLIVTAKGFAEIVNAENTGTGPVLVSQIGITDQVFTADASTVAIPGELKRLATFGGAAVADDTIHVTIRDDSADSYTLRGFGLYSAANVLLAVYSHAGETPDFIMQKAAAAMLLLQTDVRFTGISATSITFGNADFLNPPATEAVPGVVEFATDAETATGTDNTRAVHPKGLKALLDSRFGAGAPSAFVKGLLALTTAALVRTALELKGASMKDEGAGNGLDADLLDGQHGAYYRNFDNLTNVPAFAAEGHAHAIANVTGLQAALDGKAASGHTHAIANVTGLQAALDAKLATGGATADYMGSVPLYWQGNSGNDCNALPIGTKALVSTTGNANTPGFITGTTFWLIETVRSYNSDATVQRAFSYVGTPKYAQRSTSDGAAWTDWGVVDLTFDPATKLDASIVDVAATASKVVQRDGSGDIHARLIRPAFGDQSTISGAIAYRVNSTTDNYIRFCSDEAAIRAWLGAASLGANTFTGAQTNNGGVFARDGGMMYFRPNGAGSATGQMTLATTGALAVSGTITPTGGYDFGSSRKLKEIDGSMPYGLEEVRRISTLIGRYKPEYNADGRTRLFFDAEQFLEVMPEAVDAEGVEFNGERVPAIKLDQVMPPAYRAIAQLADIVEQLQREIAELKASR